VSVPFDQIPPFYIRDTTEERFSCVGEDGTVLASIADGTLLKFTVKSINHTGDIFSISGSLLQRATGPVGVQLPSQLFNKRKGEKKQASVSDNGTPNKPKDNFAKPASKTPTKQKTTIVTPNTTPSKPNNTPKSETKSNGTNGNKTPKVETPSKTVATASSAKKKKRQVAEDEVETSQSQSQQDVVEEVELPVQEIKKKRKKGSTPS